MYSQLKSSQDSTTHKWIIDTINQSENDWFIGVFKINGTYVDSSGVKRQLVNSSSLSRFYKTVDWTISTSRRNVNDNTLRFIPFVGGDKESGVSIHIHSLIEIPKDKKWKLHDSLKKNWSIYTPRSFKCSVKSELWLDVLDKSRIENQLNYCIRYEGGTFLKGTEKVLFELNSCLL